MTGDKPKDHRSGRPSTEAGAERHDVAAAERRTVAVLQAVYWLTVALCCGVVALCEGAHLAGFLRRDDGGGCEYMAAAVAEVATVVLLPAALLLFRTGGVRRRLRRGRWTVLLPLGVVRIVMMGVPLVGDTLLYYGFVSVSFAYLAIMTLVMMVFVYPSRGRCRDEVGAE